MNAAAAHGQLGNMNSFPGGFPGLVGGGNGGGGTTAYYHPSASAQQQAGQHQHYQPAQQQHPQSDPNGLHHSAAQLSQAMAPVATMGSLNPFQFNAAAAAAAASGGNLSTMAMSNQNAAATAAALQFQQQLNTLLMNAGVGAVGGGGGGGMGSAVVLVSNLDENVSESVVKPLTHTVELAALPSPVLHTLSHHFSFPAAACHYALWCYAHESIYFRK